jgi:phosphohistidine phosphatase
VTDPAQHEPERRLYLVHHAEAVTSETDPQRPLSAAGRTSVGRLAKAAAERGTKPAAIWHSGKLRARQTAEQYWSACNPLAELSVARGLQPTDPPDLMASTVAGETRDVMLVGHMPNLEQLLRLLVGGSIQGSVAFPAHGIVALDAVEGRWAERWRMVG